MAHNEFRLWVLVESTILKGEPECWVHLFRSLDGAKSAADRMAVNRYVDTPDSLKPRRDAARLALAAITEAGGAVLVGDDYSITIFSKEINP